MLTNTIIIEDNNPDKLFVLFAIFAVVYVFFSIIRMILAKQRKQRLLRVRELIIKRHEAIEEINETKRILHNNLVKQKERERAGRD